MTEEVLSFGVGGSEGHTRQIFYMNYTYVADAPDSQALIDIINDLKQQEEWLGNNYDLVKHNCSE